MPQAQVESHAVGKRRSRRFWVRVVVSLFLLSTCVCCSRQEVPPLGERVPNVLLIVIDTCRPDYLGCYGHPARATLNIDAFSRECAVFEHACCHVPLTQPSHATIFTGTLPPVHGVRDNRGSGLGPELPTLAEHCRARGMQTAAVIGALVLEHSTGVNRGFDYYDDDVIGGRRRDEFSFMERRAEVVTDNALEWLGEADHGYFVYDSAVRVLLLLKPPSGAGWPAFLPGRREEHCARLVDLMPTILEWIGSEPPPSLQGKSLIPALAGRETAATDTTYCETLSPYSTYGWSPVAAVRTKNWKYILKPKPELYHLAQDPGETRNLIEEEPQVALVLREKLVSIVGTDDLAALAHGQEITADAETLERLATLGSISVRTPETRSGGLELKDTKDMLPAYVAMRKAEDLLGSNVPLKALVEIRKAEQVDPDNQTIAFIKANAYLKAEMLNSALAIYQDLVAERPDWLRLRNNLGITYQKLGQDEKALEEYHQSIALDSTYARTYFNLGSLLFQQGNYEGAAQAWEEVLRFEPGHSPSQMMLERIRQETGTS